MDKFIGIGKVLKDSFAPVLCGASNDILRAFFNTTDEFLKSETSPLSLLHFKGIRLGWSMENQNAPLYINKVETDDVRHETRISYVYNGSAGEYCIRKINEGGIENSITCAAVCLYLGMSQKTLAERMPQLEAIAMRLEVKQGQRGCILINDSYNNDVKSLDIALDFMSRRPDSKGRSRTLILSDIYQTGLSDKELAEELLSLIKSRGVDKFIGIGKVLKDSFAPVLCGASNDILRAFFNTTDEFLKSETSPLSLLHFKGIRLGWSMENQNAPLYINKVETDDVRPASRLPD